MTKLVPPSTLSLSIFEWIGISLGCCILVVGAAWVIGARLRFGIFGFNRSLLRDMRRYAAIYEKKFKKSLERYGYVTLDENPKRGILWEMPQQLFQPLLKFACDSDQRRVINSRRRILQVTDPSTNEIYFICVPMLADTSDAQGAVAWTFGLTREQYQPTMES